jgi:hypothetical protein
MGDDRFALTKLFAAAIAATLILAFVGGFRRSRLMTPDERARGDEENRERLAGLGEPVR